MFYADQESNAAYYGNRDGGGFGGSAIMMVLVVVIVLWLLFRDDHKDGYRGYGYGDGCGPCVQPTFKDESNYEEERNINAKLCCIDKDIWNTDRDVWKTACETQQVEHCEAEKTRDLIRCEAEKEWMYKLNKSNTENAMLKSEMFTEKKFDQLAALIGGVNHKIERLECEVPKRPPVWCEGITPDTHHTDCDHGRDFPRRGRCDNFGFDGCCL